MKKERWLPVPGYEKSYEASDHGRVRSIDRIDSRGCRRKGNLLKTTRNPKSRYPTVTFGHGDKRRVHRVIMETFEGVCPPGMEVLHKDDNPLNNQLSNLRWGTRSENKLDAVRNGIHPNARKTQCKRGHSLAEAYVKKNGARQCRLCQRSLVAA